MEVTTAQIPLRRDLLDALQAQLHDTRVPRSVREHFEVRYGANLEAVREHHPDGSLVSLSDVLASHAGEVDARWISYETPLPSFPRRMTLAPRDLEVAEGRFHLLIDEFGEVRPVPYQANLEPWKGQDVLVSLQLDGPHMEPAPRRQTSRELLEIIDQSHPTLEQRKALAKLDEASFERLKRAALSPQEMLDGEPRSFAAAHVLVEVASRRLHEAELGRSEFSHEDASRMFTDQLYRRNVYVERELEMSRMVTPQVLDPRAIAKAFEETLPVPVRVPVAWEPPSMKHARVFEAASKDPSELARQLNKPDIGYSVYASLLAMDDERFTDMLRRTVAPGEREQQSPRSFAGAHMLNIESVRELQRVQDSPELRERAQARVQMYQNRLETFIEEMTYQPKTRVVEPPRPVAREAFDFSDRPVPKSDPGAPRPGPSEYPAIHAGVYPRPTPEQIAQASLKSPPPPPLTPPTFVESPPPAKESTGVRGTGQTTTEPELPAEQPSVKVAPSLVLEAQAGPDLARRLDKVAPQQRDWDELRRLPDEAREAFIEAHVTKADRDERPGSLLAANLLEFEAKLAHYQARQKGGLSPSLDQGFSQIAEYRAAQRRSLVEELGRPREEARPKLQTLSEYRDVIEAKTGKTLYELERGEERQVRVIKDGSVTLKEGTFQLTRFRDEQRASQYLIVPKKPELELHAGQKIVVRNDPVRGLEVEKLGKSRER